MNKTVATLTMTLLLSLTSPFAARAHTQSGGGFTVNGQAGTVPGMASGGGFRAILDGRANANAASGNGFYLYGGMLQVMTDQSEPSSSSGDEDEDTEAATGGGGGGGNIPSTLIFPLIESQAAQPAESVQDPLLSARAKERDALKDGAVNILDFNAVMVGWGSEGCGNNADMNQDCAVDILDFNQLMVLWGVTYPL